MTIKDLIRCYSRLLSKCETELSCYKGDNFCTGYYHGQIETLKCVLRDLKELETDFERNS